MKAIKPSHVALLATLAISGCASVQEQTESAPSQEPQAAELAFELKESEQKSAPSPAKNDPVDVAGVPSADAMMASLAETNDAAEEAVSESNDKISETAAVAPATNQTEREISSKKGVVQAQKPQIKEAAAAKVEKKVKKKPLAKAVSTKPSKRKLSSKSLKGSKSDLPISHGIWKIMQSDIPGEASMVIATPTWEMGEEGFMSQIWLTFSESQLIVNSSSDIDPSASLGGIRINDEDLIPFSRIDGKNAGIIEGKWLDILSSGGVMDIYMGFFPDRKQRSGTYKSDVVLDGLSRVVPTYRRLNQ